MRMSLATLFIIQNSMGRGEAEIAEHPPIMKWHVLWRFTKMRSFFPLLILIIFTLITLYGRLSIIYY